MKIRSKVSGDYFVVPVQAEAKNGMPDCYKIKLRGAGYRLVYQVQDDRVVVFVVAVGKREREEVYLEAMSRLD
ncbi:TPA: type II toxin-antitoxin system RelE/ParE family toxin [Aeromonas hydrophila]|jgi:mRNA interferase RelE/StbE|uniref:type II toxin-antitoxin system RelE/ParE family toxin n=1 Tax=Aeromonas TaxID=642 RepID=UPI0013165FA6|nr:type II toxin-antitoxin system RelE/ParE family toxin [Aeromonas veronii]QHB84872.1 type II toxin-antitoxin system mRNA interferase toxin, RelE/StbE family [Aeromonas veronii]HDX8351738.1 type II toxin-antitoxin system RelE/ParE family toxin [Aeromonas veronii]HDZ8915847.1 type II toxin-antitoxin system RelE/ParE family toxin [Aeromonas hydrophila]HDZ8916062.1 type II toxin-antitoxin system RelE/ParE family toxin [Aeromonas hydrophila]